jgi:ATP-binding cassette subfamily B multidrug efflux pump
MPYSNLKPRKLLSKLLKPYGMAFLKGFGALLVVNVTDIIPPMCLKIAIDAFNTPETALTTLGYCAALIAGIALLQSVFRFFWRQYFQGTAQYAVYDLRKMLFEHLLNLPFNYFKKTRTGDIMSRMTNDIQEIRFMLGMGILICLDAAFYLITVPLILIYLSPKLTLFTLIPLSCVTIFASFAKTILHRLSRELQIKLSNLSSLSEENISGIRVVKGFGTENEEIDKFDKCGQEYVKVNAKLIDFMVVFHPAIDLLVGVSMILLLYMGGKMVIDGGITLGVFMAFQGYMLKLNWPMRAIGMILASYQRGKASLERCIQILREELEQEQEQQIDPEVVGHDLEVKNLSFTFDDGVKPAIKDVSFSLKAGQVLGVTGPVGCGKTTLLQLIMKIHKPSSGRITLGGLDTAESSTKSLRSLFAYVPQEVFLFSETVRENIMFSAQDKDKPDEATAFAHMAGLKGEVEAFPNGIETMLGERGVNLSGGQKQRISIARALQASRPILILDDCTSAVDTETEKEILAGLGTNTKQSKIIVSHRMISIQNSDLIIYMDNGQIVEQGTHDELMAHNGRYATAWQRQRIKEKLEQDE